MKEKKTKILEISSFVLVMIMLVLFSTGTILMTLPKQEKSEERIIQFSTRGIPTARIKKMEFTQDKVKIGDKLGVNIETELVYYSPSGDTTVDDKFEVTDYAVWAKNIETGEVFYGSTGFSENNDYILTSHNASSGSYSAGTYKITGLTVAIDSIERPNSGFSHYIFISTDTCTTKLECDNLKYLQSTFTLGDDSSEEDVPVYEYTIALDENNPKVSIGDKLGLSLYRIDKIDEVFMKRKDLKTLMLSYTNEEDGNVVNMYVKSINDKPYIVIPSTATAGKYNLDYGYLTFYDDTSARYKNTETKTFSYNTSFTVKENEMDTSKYMFNNELYDETIAKDLTKLDDDAIITINANSLPIINSKIFESIQNTKRTLIIEYETEQWVFSGSDIKNPKTIDVSILLSKLESDSEYYNSFLKNNVTSPSAMLKFSNNGDLPGKVLIKIDKENVDVNLGNPDSVYVYYYKEDSDKLVKVAMEIQANNGFYEFYINHNSKYIMTTEEVKEEVIAEDLDMLSLNHQLVISQQQSLPMTYIIATICGVLAIVILSVVLSRKKQQHQG